MDRLRMALAGMVALALLGGTCGAVLAQDELPTPQLQSGIYYGQDEPAKQQLRIFTIETGEAPRPAVVFFHGGGLVEGSVYGDQTWAMELAQEGYVTVLADYRLFVPSTGANPWPTQLQDAQHAVKWLRAHADEFGVDPDRICAMGHSSGGHLASMVGATEADSDSDPGLDGVSSRVDCVVTAAGVVDLTVPVTQAWWATVDLPQLLGGTFEESPESWKEASAAYNIDDQTVPFLVIQGTRDDYVPVQMARNLVEALEAAGVEHVYEETTDDHFTVYSEEDKLPLVKAFLADQLGPAE